MPTCYTEQLLEKDLSFRDFALLCCRGMGIGISMRDEPLDKLLPDSFKLDSYHTKCIREEKENLVMLLNMSDEEKENSATNQYNETIERYKKQIRKRNKNRVKLETILVKTEEWEQPTSEHIGLKKFMIEQINSTIDADCRIDFFDCNKVKKDTGTEWFNYIVKETMKQISYHEENYQIDVDKNIESNKWIKDLKNSL